MVENSARWQLIDIEIPILISSQSQVLEILDIECSAAK
jgi:hypothetical protein